jgi:uncharacterized membrane protein YedE/YeeE
MKNVDKAVNDFAEEMLCVFLGFIGGIFFALSVLLLILIPNYINVPAVCLMAVSSAFILWLGIYLHVNLEKEKHNGQHH